MDSLTQIVLGASVGEVVLGKKVGNKAMLYGAIAGTIPDLDVLSRYFVDTVTYTEWHRGFSHSILFSLLFAPVFGWLISKIERKSGVSWQEWSKLMFWGLFTHPILDSFTTWGTQLFWPFDVRLAFQNIFVIDPLYTFPFLFFLILTIRQHRLSPARRKYNRMGLMVSTSYLVVTLLLKGITYRKFIDNLEDQEIVYEQVQTRPTPFNSILWNANVDTGKEYLIGEYSLFDTKPIVFRAYPKNHDLLGEMAGEDKLNRLIKITEGWYTISRKEQTLLFNDLRFGLISLNPIDPKFAFSYKLLKLKNEVIVEETPKFKEDAQNVLIELWARIWGN